MRKVIFFILIIIFNYSNAQTWQWAKQGVTNGTATETRRIITDNSDNLYVLGHYTASTVTFESTTLNSYGNKDVFLIKYDKTGVLQWANRIGSANLDNGLALAIDAAGNIYITGSFNGTATFQDVPLIQLTSLGVSDIYLAKYNSAGVLQWAKNIAKSATNELAYGLVVDDDDNIALAGVYLNNVIQIGEDADPGKVNLPTNGVRNIFMSKFNTSGALIWASTSYYSSLAPTTINSMTYSNGKYYIVGTFQGNLTLGTDNYTSAGGTDIFLFATDKNGVFQWSKSAGGPVNDAGSRIKADAAGNCYITGFIQGTAIFDATSLVASGTDFYLAKYNSTGTLQFAKKYGSEGTDVANDLAIYNDNYLYVTGYSTANFKHGISNIINSGGEDQFFAVTDLDGNPIYATSAFGTNADRGNNIYVDNKGAPIMSGYFTSNTITYGSNILSNSNSPAFIPNLSIAKHAWIVKLDSSLTNCYCQKSVTATPIGGTAPYIFLWTGGQTTQTATNLCAGTYYVTVTDNNGDVSINGITITQNSEILSSTLPVNTTCNGLSDGSISLTVSGGVSPYTFLWSNSSTNQNPSGLSEARYYVTITDITGCTKIDSADVVDPIVLNISATVTNLTCFNSENGSIDITITGGTSPYSVVWSNSETTEDIASLDAGNYTYTITDINSCQEFDNINVTEPNLISISSTVVDPTCDSDNNGSIDIAVTGGTTPYSYNWSNSETTEDIFSLVQGSYIVTVTDANSCTKIKSEYLNDPEISLLFSSNPTTCYNGTDGSINLTVVNARPPITYLWSSGHTTKNIIGLIAGNYTVTITDNQGCSVIGSTTVQNASPISQTLIGTNPTCYNGANGSINLTVYGGIAPYSYSWSNTETTQDISGLVAGKYIITITDNNLCTSIDSATINNPGEINLSFSNFNVSCNGNSDGSIILMVNNGIAPYTYLWSNGSSTKDINSLSAGTYAVIVTDINSCQKTGSTIISEPTALSISTVNTNLTCNNSNDGAIDVTVSGGILPYSYIWSNGSGNQDLSGVSVGTYSVTISDNKNCKISTTQTITEPLELSISETLTHIICNGASNGAVDITVSGGTSPYGYIWNNAAITEDLTGLSAGNYSLTVTDFNSCLNIANYTITEPSVVSISENISNISCYGLNDGEINLNVSGGIVPYSYIWSSGQNTNQITGLSAGNYDYSVTDANSCLTTGSITITEPSDLLINSNITNNLCSGECNGAINIAVSGGTIPYSYLWSNSPTTQNLSSLCSATYSLTITDNNLCKKTTSVTITEPTEIIAIDSISDVLCNGGVNGSIDLSISGGISPYSFIWSSGQSSENVSGLTAGTYNVTIIDLNSCEKVYTYNVTEPIAISTAISSGDISCYGYYDGNASISINGGTSPYAILWSNDSTVLAINTLLSGNYFATITDANNCQKIDSTIISEPLEISINSNQINVSCYSSNDGSIDITVTNGITPINYKWSNSESTEDISGLITGIYSVTVTDSNNCYNSTNVTITEPNDLVINSVISDISCFGFNNGTITTSITGGTSPYNYQWSNDSIISTISSLSKNTYYLTATDANLCAKVDSFVISEPEQLILNEDYTNPLCYNQTNGYINLIVNGGVIPYTYLWSNSSADSIINNISSGVYYYTVTDANGCNIIDSIIISESSMISANINSTNLTCFGNNNGTINTSVSGGLSPYGYLWSNNDATSSLSNLSAGKYRLTITDFYNCSAIDSVNITSPTEIIVSDSINNVSCYKLSDCSIYLTTTGGVGPYTYLWNIANETLSYIDSLESNTYFVTITDSTNCIIIKSYQVNEPAIPLNATAIVTGNNCNQDSIGLINITAFGSNGGFSYLWNDSVVTEDREKLTEGYYYLTITDIKGCVFIDSYHISGSKEITISESITQPSCKGESDGEIIIVASNALEPINYIWSNGEKTNSIYNLESGKYAITVTDINQCVGIKTIDLTSEKFFCIEVYNAFSPNSDGVNDVWNIKGIGKYPDCTVDIFNQWGVNIFSSKGYTVPWDGLYKGNLLPADTYFYIINTGNDEKSFTGSVSLIK